jgi:hypothetical protein
LLGASDNWVKKGNERVLSVSVHLKKSSTPSVAGGSTVPPAATEPKPEAKPLAPPPEPVKPAPVKVEAKPAVPEPAKPAPVKPEPVKPPAAKPEAAKPAPAEKSPVFKPVPNFDEPGKAKE